MTMSQVPPDEAEGGDSSTRQRILQAAVEEFARGGFAAARIGSIARAARVNTQLIYYYFGSKAGLHEAAIAEMVDAYGPFWEAIAHSSLREVLLGGISAVDQDTWRPWRRLLVWEGVQEGRRDEGTPGGPSGDARADAFRRQTELIAREQAAGRLPATVDADALSLLVVFSRMGVHALPQVTKMVMGEDATEEQVGDALARTLEALLAAATATASGTTASAN
jgi:TetR/AcrR family transcriptional regulator